MHSEMHICHAELALENLILTPGTKDLMLIDFERSLV
jgi:thiamine kinase-like enzyme